MVHVVFIAAPGIGHVIPLLRVASKAAHSGIIATFLASDVPLVHLNKQGVIAELVHPNLRIAALKSDGSIDWKKFTSGPGGIMALYQQMITPTDQILRALCKGEAITCGITGEPLPKEPAPTHVVSSPFIFFGPPIAKELGLKWTNLVDTSIIGAIVTQELAREAVAMGEVDGDELIGKAGIEIEGYMCIKSENLVNVFGETQLTLKSPTIWLAKGFTSLIESSDSLLVNTAEHLDGELLARLAGSKPVYAIGPILPEPKPVEESAWRAFLDRASPRSVIYTAFGSGNTLHPYAVEFITALQATGTPFVWVDRHVLATSDKKSQLEDLIAKGQGIVLDWAPQSEVLQHPAIGLFFSHGGWNSTSEALSYGVPMLIHATHAEPVLTSRVVEEKYKVGRRVSKPQDLLQALYDLKEGYFADLQAEADKIQVALAEARAENGSSDRAWQEWIDTL